MIFTQHQNFLSGSNLEAYKKHDSLCFRTTPYSTFFYQHSNTSNFIVKNFQYSIQGSKTPKIYFLFGYFLKGPLSMKAIKRGPITSNSLKIKSTLLPSKPMNQIYSSYFICRLTFFYKKRYKTIQNAQFKTPLFFCKQIFSYKNLHLNQLVDYHILKKNNLFSVFKYKKHLITSALNSPFNQTPFVLSKGRHNKFNLRFQFFLHLPLHFLLSLQLNKYSPFVDTNTPRPLRSLLGERGRVFSQKVFNLFIRPPLLSPLLRGESKRGDKTRVQSGGYPLKWGESKRGGPYSLFSACIKGNYKGKFKTRKGLKTQLLSLRPPLKGGAKNWGESNKGELEQKKQNVAKRWSRLRPLGTQQIRRFLLFSLLFSYNTSFLGKKKNQELALITPQKCNWKWSITLLNLITPINEISISILINRQRFIRNSLKGILLVNFPEKEKNFLTKNLAAENKIALITQSASLLLKDSRNMDDLLGVDDPIQILFDKVKTCIPCICFINNLDRIGKQRYEQEQKSLNWLNNSISLLIDPRFTNHEMLNTINEKKIFGLQATAFQKDYFLKGASLKRHNNILGIGPPLFEQRNIDSPPFRSPFKTSFEGGSTKKFKWGDNQGEGLTTEPHYVFGGPILKNSQVIGFKNLQNSNQKFLKYLTWSSQPPNKNQLQPSIFFLHLLSKLSVGSEHLIYKNLKKQTFLQFSSQKNLLDNISNSSRPTPSMFYKLVYHRCFIKKMSYLQNNALIVFGPPPQKRGGPYSSRICLRDSNKYNFYPKHETLQPLPLIFKYSLNIPNIAWNKKPYYILKKKPSTIWSMDKQNIFATSQASRLLYAPPKTCFGEGKTGRGFKAISLNMFFNLFENTDTKKKKLIYLRNGYEFRLPFWLSKNSFFLSSKLGVNKVKLLYSFYYTKKENLFRALQSKVKPLSLQKTFSQTLSVGPPKFLGPPFFEQPSIDSPPFSPPLFLGPPLFRGGGHLTPPYNKLWFPPHSNKFEWGGVLYGGETKKEALNKHYTNNEGSNPAPQLFPLFVDTNTSRPLPSLLGKRGRVFSQKVLRLSPSVFGPPPLKRGGPFNPPFQQVERGGDKEGGGPIVPSKLVLRGPLNTGAIRRIPLLNGGESYTEGITGGAFNKMFGDQKPKVLFTGAKEKERNKNNSFKISETDIIKRTALLKFLQILDGFHTTSGINLINYSKLFKKLNLSKIVLRLPKKIKLKSSQLKIDDKNYPSIKNFLAPLILQKRSIKHNNAIMINSIQNNKCFSKKIVGPRVLTPLFFGPPLFRGGGHLTPPYNKLWFPPHSNKFEWGGVLYGGETKGNFNTGIFRFNKLETQKSTIDNSTIIIYKSINEFLGHASQKKTNRSLSFEFLWFSCKVLKWEIYLKNQPSLKSLNLLCVWPSYIEDRLGAFNLNDSASYLLPEYFQLLGNGPKFKKQGITLIASTNNLTTLDAALLRPGRFDTIINFSHSFLSMARFDRMFKHSPSFTQNNHFSLSTSSMKDKNIVDISVWPDHFDQNLIVREKKNNYLFNNTILVSSSSLVNIIFKRPGPETIKNQFYPQFTVLDIPSQSTPIKTFIDVSFFIQYKLWWSSNNGQLSSFNLYQKNSVQKSKTLVFRGLLLNFEKSVISNFKVSTDSVVLILKLKIYRLKNLICIFIGFLRRISFRFFYNLFQFFIMFRTQIVKLNRNSFRPRPFFKFRFSSFSDLMTFSTAFLKPSSKSWIDSNEAMIVKNADKNNFMLTKYHEIYKLKKIKLKQLSFFNLHPFTSFILKRWPEVTKPNKIKQHFKFQFINVCLPLKKQTYYGSLLSFKDSKDIFPSEIKNNTHADYSSKLKKIPRKTVMNNKTYDWFQTIYKWKCCNAKKDKLEITNNRILLKNPNLVSNYAFSLKGSQATPCEAIEKNPNENKEHNFIKTRESFFQAKILSKLLLREYLPVVFSNNRIDRHLLTLPYKTPPHSNKFEWEGNYNLLYGRETKSKALNSLKERKLNMTGLKHYAVLPDVSLHAKQWGRLQPLEIQNFKMGKLDLSFFLLIFYTMFFEKIKKKKITLNTIKIFMPYKSLILSHFLLSQGKTYGFSCKNFEILIYNKFQNFFVDL